MKDVVEVLGFPGAGTHTDSFRTLARRLTGTGRRVEVTAVMLPGHGPLLQVAPLTSIEQMAEWAVEHHGLLAGERSPLALLGHAMGAYVAFEVARRLTAAGRPPETLVVDGTTPPHRHTGHGLVLGTDEEVVQAVQTLGLLPSSALQSPAMRRMLLPTLRADLGALEAYRCAPEGLPALGDSTLLRVLAAAREDGVVVAPEGWAEVSSGSVESVAPAGGAQAKDVAERECSEDLVRALVRVCAGCWPEGSRRGSEPETGRENAWRSSCSAVGRD